MALQVELEGWALSDLVAGLATAMAVQDLMLTVGRRGPGGAAAAFLESSPAADLQLASAGPSAAHSAAGGAAGGADSGDTADCADAAAAAAPPGNPRLLAGNPRLLTGH